MSIGEPKNDAEVTARRVAWEALLRAADRVRYSNRRHAGAIRTTIKQVRQAAAMAEAVLDETFGTEGSGGADQTGE